MNKIFKVIAFIFALILTVTAVGCQKDDGSNIETNDEAQKLVNEALAKLSEEDFTYAQLIGRDALGRDTMPIVQKEEKYVGIFYFVLLGQKAHTTIYDISKFLEQYGNGMDNPVFDLNSKISPYSSFHYWGEPLYGYYKSTDKWVIRRHLELFMNAGIDFLYLDYSNGITYPATVKALLDVILELQAEGYKNVPTITFMCPNAEKSSSATNQWGSLDTLSYLYDTYYTKSEYDSCWFRADKSVNAYSNPMVIGRFNSVKEEKYLDNLWLKELQWPMSANSDDSFPWIDWSSAEKTQYNHNGIMNVSVSQHANSWSSTSFTDSLTGSKIYQYRARGYDPKNPKSYGTDEENILKGSNFEWQFGNALAAKDELYMMTITGWNEWVAQKITYGNRDYAVFNDAFNCAFSRDAEMMKGGYGDNYYMQITRNIRDFLGIRIDDSDNVALFDRVTINSIANISNLPAKFVDITGDTVARTDMAIDDKIDYSDSSNRNNILKTRVGNNGENLYIAVETDGDISKYLSGDTSWMNLYISTGAQGGWNNYNYVINRNPDIKSGKTGIESLSGSSGAVNKVGDAKIEVKGNIILYTIPLSALNVNTKTVIGIKATDNIRHFGNIDDFYISGDSAPMGRLNYAYKIA